MKPKTAFVLKGYPRLSETFIAQEILALERLGMELAIYSLRHPTDQAVHPVHHEIAAPVRYLPEHLKDEPLRALRGLGRAVALAGFGRALLTWLKDLVRDPSANRVRRFGQACVLAAELPGDIGHLHAHFLHTPASVARYAARLRGLAWSVSAHAVDIWTSPAWEKREKLMDAAFCVTCTRGGRDHLEALAPGADKVRLAYHGLDLARFPPAVRDGASDRDGSSADRAVEVLAVGRAVEKKGFDVLLAALAGLDTCLHWRLTHVGGGERLDTLKAEAERLGIGDRVRFLGPLAYDGLLAAYRAADLFALPCRVAANGDRDGLPNVLMEAQSQSLAVISTFVSAVPELIIDGETGRLVAADDPAALGEALAALIADPKTRARYGAAGADRVRRRFSQASQIGELAALFELENSAEADDRTGTERPRCALPSTHP